jgi:hypothetical protein
VFCSGSIALREEGDELAFPLQDVTFDIGVRVNFGVGVRINSHIVVQGCIADAVANGTAL